MITVTKESLAARIAELEALPHLSLKEEFALEAFRMLLSAATQEPDAYVTYKGYLLHAADPKVSEHSEPEPLYYNDMLKPLRN